MDIIFHGVHGGLRGYLWNGISISVSYDNQAILIDCGNKRISEEANLLSQLEAILFSHTHWDHRAALNPLLKKMNKNAEASGKKRMIRIYSPEDLPSLPKQYSKGKFLKYNISKDIPENIGSFKIEHLETTHHKKTFAYKITAGDKSLVYTADTGLFDGLYNFCKGADALIIESTFLDPWKRWTEIRGHMIPEYAAMLVDEAQPKQVIFMHYMLSGKFFKEKFEQHLEKYNGPVSIAHVGDSLVL